MPTAPVAHAEDLADFVDASPSSYHAAAEVARRLQQAGFAALQETDAWPDTPGKYLVVRDGAVIAWIVPQGATAPTPVRVFGAHSDSPGFKLKPKPTTGRYGWLQAGVEVYGGPLLNSWLDRELRLAGRLVLDDGTSVLAATGPLLRLPQLAIHLDREANSGLALDKQGHTQPVWGLGSPESEDLLAELAASVSATGSSGDGTAEPVDAARIRGYDVVTADSARGGVFGKDDVFFAATRSGAAGPFLEDVLERIGLALGAGREERMRALASSWCVSSDVGHSVHPNYADKHDPEVRPVLGSGPILKINANQRYATDGAGAAAWHEWCAQAGATSQEFVSNNLVPCGSTIGPITATRLGIRTVDVGIPILSMHSARELAGVSDLFDLTRIAEAFFRS